MSDQKMELEMLLKKYQDQVVSLQEQLTTAKNRLGVVSGALELLRTEGNPDQAALFQPIVSDLYKNMSMTEAINNILKTSPASKVSSETILSELQKHGFHTESKNLKRDVFTRLWRLTKGGKLGAKTEKGIKKYYLFERKEEDNA